ncbi:hypothetical protein OED52_12215 [Rhodococcus sp. Z13]|uniref:Uncharacterized protein n=1 Tax=Rhodococcus sacchari TaxID=2962047 RepID=A0ACD4DBT6_9NOCA|nr:hypothetical protein [Rhodococcus sp. Z13]UYP17467.1 hypothetical protein OED52_12215 [Rhodococcus sp. Z13]
MTVKVPPSQRRQPGRSTAAQRAYQRRSQRAAQLGLSPTETRGRRLGGGRVRTRIPFVATIIALLGVGMAVTLLLTTRATEDSYELSAARAYNESLTQKRAVLQRDVETGNSAPALALAAARLGMIPAGQVARLVVAEDGSVQVVGDPVPAQGAPPAPLDPPARADARIQTPLAGSPGAESPRPLEDVREDVQEGQPRPRSVGDDGRRAASTVEEGQTPAPEPGATPEGPAPAPAAPVAEQSTIVSELPQPEAPRSIAPGQTVPPEPEDGLR